MRTTNVSLDSGDTERRSATIQYALRSWPRFRRRHSGTDTGRDSERESRHALRQLGCETFHEGGVVELPIMRI